jgi:hypothetical protein
MSYELRTAKLSVALFIFGCQGWLSLMLPSIYVHAIAIREQEQVVQNWYKKRNTKFATKANTRT